MNVIVVVNPNLKSYTTKTYIPPQRDGLVAGQHCHPGE